MFPAVFSLLPHLAESKDWVGGDKGEGDLSI